MKMASPLNEIVSELSRLNPDASSDEICSSVIGQIETVLTEVLKTIKLPSLPSPAQIRVEEWKLGRRGKRSKALRGESSLKRKTTLIQQFEYVKQQLNGHEVDTSLVEPTITYGDLDTVPRLILHPTSGSAEMERDGTSSGWPALLPGGFKEPLRMHTALLQEQREELLPRIPLDAEIHNRISTDFLFADVLKAIEVKIRSFVHSHPLKMSFTVSSLRDIEVPEWRKIILGVNAPDMDFDQKMVIWEKVDAEVRQALHEVEQRVNGSDKDKIQAINRNLFIRMKLP